MIRIYGLYFLLLIEALIAMMVVSFLIFRRVRYYRDLYRSTARDLDEMSASRDALRTELVEMKNRADHEAAESASSVKTGGATSGGSEGLIARVAELESQIQDKDKHMTALETKFADLEKEYMILYQQQQQQQNQPKID